MASDGTIIGCMVEITTKTGVTVVQLKADEYGYGVVGAYDRKGKGRTLNPRTQLGR